MKATIIDHTGTVAGDPGILEKYQDTLLDPGAKNQMIKDQIDNDFRALWGYTKNILDAVEKDQNIDLYVSGFNTALEKVQGDFQTYNNTIIKPK